MTALRACPPTASLRAPGTVLLISTYELGHAPHGIASPAGILRSAGFAPGLLDLAVDSLDADRTCRARLVSISVPMHTALRLGMEAARRIRALNPTCRVGFHGLYAGLNRALLLESGADWVLGAEYESSLLALCQAVERGEVPSSVPDLPLLPSVPIVPHRAGLPRPERYARYEHGAGTHLAGYLEASRGCKHHCRHCPLPPVYDGRFFVVPVDVLLADARQQVALGVQHLTFGDPDFLNGPTHALRVARALHREHPEVSFDFTAKVEHLVRHRVLLPELAALGCRFIITAVESLNPRVLEVLAKGHKPEDADAALAAVRAAGIALRPTFVPFTPWETLPSFLALLRWLADADLVGCVDPVQLGLRLLVPPGSRLLEGPWLTPHLGELDAAALTYRWRHPDPRMDRLQQQLAALAGEAERRGLTAGESFAAAWQCAHTAAGLPVPPLNLRPVPPAPRLTESWFC